MFNNLYGSKTFDLNTTPFSFTEVVRPLIKYWRIDAVRKAYFLDDNTSI